VEGANNPFARKLSSTLLSHYRVIDVSPNLTSQYRSRKGQGKTDEIDAGNVARAVLANPELVSFAPSNKQEHLKSLTRTRQKLVEQQTALRLSLKSTSLEASRQALAEVIASFSTGINKLEREMRVLSTSKLKIEDFQLAFSGYGP
jgi:transposase